MLTSALAAGGAWMCPGYDLMISLGGGAFLVGVKMRRLGVYLGDLEKYRLAK